MAKLETINGLMKQVHRALSSAKRRSGVRNYSHAILQIPGLGSTRAISGIDCQDVLVPTPVELEDPAQVLAETLTYLSDEVVGIEARRQLQSLFGRLVVDFTLLGKTPESRLARLLWTLGKGVEKELGANTLVIKSPKGDFGVRDGKLVGGPYAGCPQDLDLTSIQEKERLLRTRSKYLVEARTILEGREDSSAYWIFCLLYARSEWDSRVIINTLLMFRPGMSDVNRQDMIDKIMAVPDPYMALYKLMVPVCMTFTDFVTIFGNPYNRGNVRPSSRLKLANKVQDLPFFN